ncbi:MAG TPA: SusC/RagA family TonB-linked outer membrane protein, partial [Agriterribacter sp.]|nr:SusC/RagA family TonB-linked outer membrane protein [Agriterribacter sp.]
MKERKLRRLPVLLCIFLLCQWQTTLAQDVTVQGRVTTAGRPDGISGVSVTILGSAKGTTTDDEGQFQLTGVPHSGSLVFSSVGFTTQTIAVKGRSTINVALEAAEASQLDQVVVIGYGSAKRKDLTGAVASVDARKLEQEAPRSIQDLLRGNAAGLVIGQGNSAKADASLLVRGVGTLKAGSGPLHVIDGVIFYGALTDINPNDIQSIDILKDASATAVYGAMAANGVVLITTKKGTKGKPRITFNANVGFAENAGMPRIMDSEEFLAWRYDYEVGRRTSAFLNQYPEMFINPDKLTNVSQLDWYNYDKSTPVTSVNDEDLTRTWLTRLELKTPEIDNYLANNITNWQDLVFQKGFQQDYTVSVSNRTESTAYYFSVNHTDREGIIVGNRYTNFRTRLNLESKITSFLKVGANTNFAVRNEGFLQADWAQMTRISPYGSNNLDDPNSIYRRLPTGDATPVNPFHDNLYRDRKDMYNTLNSSIYGIITLPFGFEFQSNFSPSFTWREYYNHESSKNPEWVARGGSSERTNEKTYEWILDNILRWKKRFNDHNFEITLLQNAEKGQFWRTKATTSGYTPSDILGYHRLQAGSVPLNES